MNRQHVANPMQHRRETGHLDLLEVHRGQVRILIVGAGVPGGRAHDVAPSHFRAVQVSDESIVVANSQRQLIEPVGLLRKGEGNANVATALPSEHGSPDVERDEILVAHAGLVANAAGRQGPRQIIECLAASPGVVNRAGRHQDAFGCILVHEHGAMLAG